MAQGSWLMGTRKCSNSELGRSKANAEVTQPVEMPADRVRKGWHAAGYPHEP